MAKGKKSSSAKTKSSNDERHCKKANKKNPGPKKFSGHSIGGYSIKKYGAERAAELAEGTRPRSARRAAKRARRSGTRTAVAA